MKPDLLLSKILASDFVDEELVKAAFNVDKSDVELIAELFMSRDVHARPNISWFFDRELYFIRNPDKDFTDTDPMIDFFASGYSKGCQPHPFIDLGYLSDQIDLSGWDAFDLTNSLRKALSPSPYFDPIFYSHKYSPSCQSAYDSFLHYLSQGVRLSSMPNPYLDPPWYSARYGDVAAFEAGSASHFISFGDGARRRPSASFDPEWYCNFHKDLTNLTVPPLMHFLKHGLNEGRLPSPLGSQVRYTAAWSGVKQPSSALRDQFDESPHSTLESYATFRTDIAAMERRKIESFSEYNLCYIPNDHLFKIDRLKFDSAERPKLTILIPCFNEFEYSYESLLALCQIEATFGVQVILADDASTDMRVSSFSKVSGLEYVRQPKNVGFLRNCNQAFAKARGEYILLLNNDTQVAPDAISVLVNALDKDATVGAVGPKLLFPNGRLQEAGCRIHADGETSLIGLFGDPRAPEISSRRDVDYCSGAALMVRTALIGDVLFDERFAPAYCEDVDLCLRIRSQGFKVVYIPEARVMHHLSVSTKKEAEERRRQLASINQHKLLEKWSGEIADMNSVRMIAFYLPQFHPIPENDKWWGQGFTEWSNVSKAKPRFDGHYQPHLPADLGYYDLRLTEILGSQYQLARRYGIEGFCVYYYNFSGRRVLHEPMDRLLRTSDVEFRYCLCWANENWTKHWDGGERDVLLEQDYTEELIRDVSLDAVRFAKDRRQIRIDGMPLFLIYRPLLIPDIKSYTDIIRSAFKSELKTNVKLVYVESMETVNANIDPQDIGFDASVQFPPQGVGVASSVSRPTSTDWNGKIYDFRATALNDLGQSGVSYTRYPGVFGSWDNTPRQPKASTLFENVSPELFQGYLEAKLRIASQTLPAKERFVFINAWNEWAEGAHLEPDQMFGHRWLEAVRGAIQCEKLDP